MNNSNRNCLMHCQPMILQILEYLRLHYDSDIDAFTLFSQLRLLPFKFKVGIGNIVCFDEFLHTVKQLPPAESSHIKKVITTCKILHVNPVTSATGHW